MFEAATSFTLLQCEAITLLGLINLKQAGDVRCIIHELSTQIQAISTTSLSRTFQYENINLHQWSPHLRYYTTENDSSSSY